jgi:23S rRNA pseudouridine955/2504/2580 synthase
MKEIKISKNEENTTLIKVLIKHFPNATSSFLYKMIRKKNIVLNGKKCDGKEHLAAGDTISVFFSDDTFNKFSGNTDSGSVDREFDILSKLDTNEFEVIYEDEDILAINKPVGMLSQKAEKNDISANELFLSYMIKNKLLTLEEYKVFKPSVANRLDRNTSGLLLFGKTMKGLHYLSDALKERSIDKYYVCLCEGVIKDKIKTEAYLIKDEKTNKVIVKDSYFKGAKSIITEYEPLSDNGKYTRLRVHLITGKSHQIRAHLAFLGYPLLGDEKYGNHKLNKELKIRYDINSQLLHAYEIDFKNGNKIIAPIPQIFYKIEFGV